jgi:hypothetical protein
MIEELQIHPITSIPILSNKEKSILIENNLIYCKDLLADPSALDLAKISGSKREEVLKIARIICKTNN